MKQVKKILDTLGIERSVLKHLEGYRKYDRKDIFNDENIFVSDDYSDSERLSKAIYSLESLYDFYQEKEISDEIFYATLSDLKYRVDRYYKNNQCYGLSAHDMKWLTQIYRAETFKIKALKFRLYPFDYEEIERSGNDALELSNEDKQIYKNGLESVYIHIEEGANLSPQSVDESLKVAKYFFDATFKERNFKLFVCRSWLMYPGLVSILKEDSNIIKFQKRFKIIGKHSVPDQSLLRIYKTTDMEIINTMEKTTSLQKSMYKNIDKLGVAVGVLWKEEI